MNLVRALGSVGGLTLASRVLALVRDSLAARYVGAGFAADAFNGVAFRLPNMFRALFAEGAFSAAFIPMFNRKAAGEGGMADGYRFAERALALLLPVLILFTLVLLVAAWPLTMLLSGGFARQNPTHEQLAYAVTLSRITIPYLALISLASLLGGILNSLDLISRNRLQCIGAIINPKKGRRFAVDQEFHIAVSTHRNGSVGVHRNGGNI